MVERNHRRAPFFAPAILARHPRRDRRQLGLRLFDRRASAATRDHVEEPSPAAIARCRRERQPHRLLRHPAEPGRLERGRHHSDDGPHFPVHRHPSSNDRWIGAESSAPHRIAEHHDVRAAVGLVVVGKIATECGTHAEDPEEGRRHLRRGDSLRGRAGDRRGFGYHCGDPGQRRRARPPRLERGDRCDVAIGAARGIAFPHGRELRGSGIRQRPQEDSVHQAEDGARESDAEREGQHAGAREPGIATEHAQGIDRVPRRVVERPEAARVTRILFVPFDAAEVSHRRPARLVGAHPAPNAFGDLRLDVVPHLVVHRPLDGTAPEHRARATHEAHGPPRSRVTHTESRVAPPSRTSPMRRFSGRAAGGPPRSACTG